MKVGIVTQVLSRNYGGILQNYALQTVLRRMGHEPVTFDRAARPASRLKYLASTIKAAAYKAMRLHASGRFYHTLTKRPPHIGQFVERNIRLTRRIYEYSPKDIKRLRIDAIVVGSDQVWRRPYQTNLYDSFLKFAETTDVRRVAYAASFGIDGLEYTPEEVVECGRLLKIFDGVSVRETSGVGICRDYFGVESVRCVDPTLLLEAKDYEALCGNIRADNSRYLLCYMLDDTDGGHPAIMRMAAGCGLEVKFIGADFRSDASVEEWLAYFRDAAFVVTDSFHGTVFSIIFRKPFVSVVNEGRGAERFFSLLSMLGLESRLWNPESDYPDIDWVAVEATLKETQKQSLDFLSANLRHGAES